MQVTKLVSNAVVAFVLFWSLNTNALTIDTFDFNQAVDTDPATTGTPSLSIANDVTSIFGAEREISIVALSGANSTFSVNPATSPGFATFENSVGSQASVEIVYDAVGTSGFAPTDFTEGGAHDRFLFSVDFADFSTNLTMEVTSAGGAVSEVDIAMPSFVFSSTAFAINFASFLPKAGGTGAADFSALESLKLTMTTVSPATDLHLDYLVTSDTTALLSSPPPPPPTSTPPPDPPPAVSEPQTLMMLGLGILVMARYRRRLLKKA
ncbi:MAG: PEP-CTERM sorting domain-containing protein [Alphaproteobacteria bacterium]|nr:PEP-CTERM sorting domain-containing protein [Alphaproteobacteria bacterium]